MFQLPAARCQCCYLYFSFLLFKAVTNKTPGCADAIKLSIHTSGTRSPQIGGNQLEQLFLVHFIFQRRGHPKSQPEGTDYLSDFLSTGKDWQWNVLELTDVGLQLLFKARLYSSSCPSSSSLPSSSHITPVAPLLSDCRPTLRDVPSLARD